jgi:hypothetical protein
MIGAGVAAGSFMGGDSNAARVPTDAMPEIVGDVTSSLPPPAILAREASTEIAKTSVVTPAPRPPAASTVIAMRFPTDWGRPLAAADSQGEANAAPRRAMAYATEPNRDAPAPAASYQLASVDPAPAPLPPRRAARPAPKHPELFNDAQLASIKLRLRLTQQQEHYWPQVEKALRAISYRAAQQNDPRRPVRGAPAAAIDPNSPEVQQLKSAAFPLIMSLREDQKQEVRQLAHTMGLSKVATMF